MITEICLALGLVFRQRLRASWSSEDGNQLMTHLCIITTRTKENELKGIKVSARNENIRTGYSVRHVGRYGFSRRNKTGPRL